MSLSITPTGSHIINDILLNPNCSKTEYLFSVNANWVIIHRLILTKIIPKLEAKSNKTSTDYLILRALQYHCLTNYTDCFLGKLRYSICFLPYLVSICRNYESTDFFNKLFGKDADPYGSKQYSAEVAANILLLINLPALSIVNKDTIASANLVKLISSFNKDFNLGFHFLKQLNKESFFSQFTVQKQQRVFSILDLETFNKKIKLLNLKKNGIHRITDDIKPIVPKAEVEQVTNSSSIAGNDIKNIQTELGNLKKSNKDLQDSNDELVDYVSKINTRIGKLEQLLSNYAHNNHLIMKHEGIIRDLCVDMTKNLSDIDLLKKDMVNLEEKIDSINIPFHNIPTVPEWGDSIPEADDYNVANEEVCDKCPETVIPSTSEAPSNPVPVSTTTTPVEYEIEVKQDTDDHQSKVITRTIKRISNTINEIMDNTFHTNTTPNEDITSPPTPETMTNEIPPYKNVYNEEMKLKIDSYLHNDTDDFERTLTAINCIAPIPRDYAEIVPFLSELTSDETTKTNVVKVISFGLSNNVAYNELRCYLAFEMKGITDSDKATLQIDKFTHRMTIPGSKPETATPLENPGEEKPSTTGL